MLNKIYQGFGGDKRTILFKARDSQLCTDNANLNAFFLHAFEVVFRDLFVFAF